MELLVPLIVTAFNIISVGGGLLWHYAKSETKNQERHKRVTEIIEDHEQRISQLEDAKTQTNGQSTYIPRNECLRERERLDSKICKVREKANGLETRVTVLERGT